MRWIKVTRTNCGSYDGAMWVNADQLLALQRISDKRGTYTMLIAAVPEAPRTDPSYDDYFPDVTSVVVHAAKGNLRSPPSSATSRRWAVAPSMVE